MEKKQFIKELQDYNARNQYATLALRVYIPPHPRPPKYSSSTITSSLPVSQPHDFDFQQEPSSQQRLLHNTHQITTAVITRDSQQRNMYQSTTQAFYQSNQTQVQSRSRYIKNKVSPNTPVVQTQEMPQYNCSMSNTNHSRTSVSTINTTMSSTSSNISASTATTNTSVTASEHNDTTTKQTKHSLRLLAAVTRHTAAQQAFINATESLRLEQLAAKARGRLPRLELEHQAVHGPSRQQKYLQQQLDDATIVYCIAEDELKDAMRQLKLANLSGGKRLLKKLAWGVRRVVEDERVHVLPTFEGLEGW